ncbi:hypothetical protein C7W93_18570 [Glaciimonas sp. PCH181]|nr:hypothetical protein C7W93_18570 [Glaciimonas sp. PCH181]
MQYGGAALGALLTSYAVIPFFGARMTTLIAALLNLLVALAALELARRMRAASLISRAPAASVAANAGIATALFSGGGSRMLAGAWLALGLGGVLSLGLEVIYVHLLSIVAGNRQ